MAKGKNIAFIGLGVMGYPMAGHLASNGYNVTVFNRTKAKSEKWCAEFGGQKENTPKGLIIGSSLIKLVKGQFRPPRSLQNY